jgi:hypothetical protein
LAEFSRCSLAKYCNYPFAGFYHCLRLSLALSFAKFCRWPLAGFGGCSSLVELLSPAEELFDRAAEWNSPCGGIDKFFVWFVVVFVVVKV